MGDFGELLVTSCRSSLQLWRGLNCASTNNVHSYRVHGCIENSSLNIIGNDYIMVAEQNKSLLHVWPIGSTEETTKPRMVLPEPARAVCVSPDNCYLAVAISKKLYVWQICSGILLTAQEIHLRTITCMTFSSNSDYLIVGAVNGSVLVYNFGDLINIEETYQVQKDHGHTKPLHKILDHTSEVTNIKVGGFSLKSRFATSSLDNTCRIYQLVTGRLLLQLVYTEGISSFTLDNSFWNLFLGGCTGSLQQFRLTDPPKTTIHHVNDTDSKLHFIGHTQRITCLALNITNEILVSGSEDKLVVIWNIESRQMLNQLEHKSPITNVGFIFSDVFDGHKPKIILSELHITIALNNQKYEVSVVQDDDIVFSDDSDYEEDHKVSNDGLEDKLLRSYSVNEQLYSRLTRMFADRDGVK